MSDNAKLTLGDSTVELPIVTGSENEKALDISKLRQQTGYVTLDNGFVNTGSCASGITFLDGEKGILRYRGYPIEQVAEKSHFLETSYMVIYGDFPTSAQLEEFEKKVVAHSILPEGLCKIIDQFPVESHPMAVLSAATVALSSFYPQLTDQDLTPEKRDEVMCLMLGQTLAIATYFFRRTKGLPGVKYDPSESYCGNFLNMMFDEQGYKVDPEVAAALDVLLILHVDHEQNCSTSTVRVVGSSKANLFASISAGIDALWGPLHGGANQAVLEMLEAIQNDGGDYKKFLEKAKDKSDPFRLMGFGHRVYKNFDPRAKIIKSACDKVLNNLGIKDPLLDIAKGLEEEALRDPYFVERKLYPNVDFYSGIIYRALGIPTNMFTVMFVLGRLPGWMAQWKELLESPGMKIGRPRQIYVGETERSR